MWFLISFLNYVTECMCCCYGPFSEPYAGNFGRWSSNYFEYIECFGPYRCACCPLTLEEFKQYMDSKYTCRAICKASCCGDIPEILRGERPHFLNENSKAYEDAECAQMFLFYVYGPFSIFGYMLECGCVATSMMCSYSTNICKESFSNNSCVGCCCCFNDLSSLCCFNVLSSLCQEAPPPDQEAPQPQPVQVAPQPQLVLQAELQPVQEEPSPDQEAPNPN